MNLLLGGGGGGGGGGGISAEEIPDWMLSGTLECFRTAMIELLNEEEAFSLSSIRTDATPRRLALRAEGIPAGQATQVESAWGPATSAPQAGSSSRVR